MATYVTKRCPHCGYAYQIFKSGDQRRYGCPRKICTNCKKHFWDTDIKEPALYGYENSHETANSIKRWFALLLCSAFTIMFIGSGIFILSTGDSRGGVCVGVGGLFALYIGVYIKEKIYEKKHHADIIAKQQKEYDASFERLQNSIYLAVLAEHDYLADKLLRERTGEKPEHYAQRPQ